MPASSAAALTSTAQAAAAGLTKNGTKVIMHTPPLPASRASTSSGTLRG